MALISRRTELNMKLDTFLEILVTNLCIYLFFYLHFMPVNKGILLWTPCTINVTKPFIIVIDDKMTYAISFTLKVILTRHLSSLNFKNKKKRQFFI